eukprot:4043547-Pyramimonas_sp.AAC.1
MVSLYERQGSSSSSSPLPGRSLIVPARPPELYYPRGIILGSTGLMVMMTTAMMRIMMMMM